VTPRHRKFEAVVIGGGPAGSASAITLAKAGHEVLLIEKSGGETFKVGEGLPPAAKPLLRELGVMERFNAGPHLPSYGNQSAWGSRLLHSTDFIRDPNGHGWHLHRPQFDAMLRETARDAGACVYEATPVTGLIHGESGNWRFSIATSEGPLEVSSQWLIDCTGRRNWVARQKRVKRISYDCLLGFVTLFNIAEPKCEPDLDSVTLVESSPHGWWYTALLPTRQRVVVYLTDADTETSKAARYTEGYIALLNQTEHVRARLTEHGYTLGSGSRVTSANTSRLEHCAGNGWLAAGDACASFDPLSSQGILAALYSGLKAGNAIHQHLKGNTAALYQYEQIVNSVYDTYLRNRIAFYSYEQRWPESKFWSRRHQAL
jgi:flavin-dependent dehydrogenase